MRRRCGFQRAILRASVARPLAISARVSSAAVRVVRGHRLVSPIRTSPAADHWRTQSKPASASPRAAAARTDCRCRRSDARRSLIGCRIDPDQQHPARCRDRRRRVSRSYREEVQECHLQPAISTIDAIGIAVVSAQRSSSSRSSWNAFCSTCASRMHRQVFGRGQERRPGRSRPGSDAGTRPTPSGARRRPRARRSADPRRAPPRRSSSAVSAA